MNFIASMLLSLAVPQALPDGSYSFERIWALAQKNLPSLSAARHEGEAASIAKDRAGRHWYPRAFVTGRAFNSNDPAMNFMGVLGQRKIEATDFAPSALNHPGGHFFTQGTLGVDLPLYEGGMRHALSLAAHRGWDAKEAEQKAVTSQEYSELATHFAALLTFEEQKAQLQALLRAVEGIMSQYRIGSKSNPVGYSGLLGLKNLKNRITGLLIENAAKADGHGGAIRAAVKELPEGWKPATAAARQFLTSVYPSRPTAVVPLAVLAARNGAEAVEKMKAVERAQLLPRVGVFAQGDLYNGKRDTATAYTTGAYLQWNIFNASQYGATSQAEHTAAAAHARADQLAQRMEGQAVAARSASLALEKNLLLLDESAALLAEQTSTARTLFRNGSINALQLVEVLSRRADLLVNRAAAESEWAQALATLKVSE